MMKSKLILVPIVFLLVACQPTVCEGERLEKYFDKAGSDLFADKPPYIIFVPFGSCGSCLQKMVAFSKEVANDKRFAFVLSSQSGKKAITIHYSDEEFTANNFLIDTSNYPYENQLIGSNSTLYCLKDGCYVRKEWTPISIDEDLRRIKEAIKGNK